MWGQLYIQKKKIALGVWHLFSPFVLLTLVKELNETSHTKTKKIPFCMDPSYFDPDFKLMLSYKAHPDFIYRRLQNAVVCRTFEKLDHLTI